MSEPEFQPVKHIRITDPHVIRIVEEERESSGEPTASKTAGRLIIERLTLKEDRQRPAKIAS